MRAPIYPPSPIIFVCASKVSERHLVARLTVSGRTGTNTVASLPALRPALWRASKQRRPLHHQCRSSFHVAPNAYRGASAFTSLDGGGIHRHVGCKTQPGDGRFQIHVPLMTAYWRNAATETGAEGQYGSRRPRPSWLSWKFHGALCGARGDLCQNVHAANGALSRRLC